MLYKGEKLKQISFPLGGIGTGSIGLGGDGRLIDWEIFNRPSKGSLNGYSHFALRAVRGDKIDFAVLCGDIKQNYIGEHLQKAIHGFGFGPDGHTMCGFPHFKNVEFNGEFPIAELTFSDEKFPGKVKMTAFNPFIPSDTKNSSIPAAFFGIEVENTQDEEIKYQIVLAVTNPYECSHNEVVSKDGYTCLKFSNAGAKSDSVEYGDLCICSDCDRLYTQTNWFRGEWKESIITYANELASDELLKERLYDDDGSFDTGMLVAEITVLPKTRKEANFVISWNIPNNFNYWNEYKNEDGTQRSWKNYYATVFEDSVDTAVYSLKNRESLFSRTLKFKNTLHCSTLPEAVIDAASSSLSVLKSPTVLRLEDGSFYGWEGVKETEGVCEGTCQHVWNYAYALCFLFPELERSIRKMEFTYSTDTDGRMGFRIMLPLGREMTDFRACVDGQMGAVIKSFREWKISGDNEWLNSNWDNIKKVLEYAWSKENPDCWDEDKDGVLEGRQHHTLDMELFGPSSWLEGFYLAALKAAAQMAEFLGDYEKAKEYSSLFDKGYKWTKENLFNGRYFIQKTDITDKSITDKYEASDKYWNEEANQIIYQIAGGSSIDQVLAQWHADLLGLGEIYDKDQLSLALDNMMRNNFKPSMRYFLNPWRIFSVNDEAGSVICVYPDGEEKPKIPVPYCEETMTGFEYSFAGILCSQGRIDDGIKVVKAVRDRFDGEKRNPWNEFECGSNYARSMASYALIPILSGFEFDMPHNHIGFNPYKAGDFKCIWSLDNVWGNFEISGDTVKISVYEGSIKLSSVGVEFADRIMSVKIDGNETDFEFDGEKITFSKTEICESIEIKI